MKRSRSALFTLATSATWLALASAPAAFAARELDAPATTAAVARLTTQILGSSQFAQHPLDDALAERFLERYLDALDGNHMVFLQSDVAEFARFRAVLADGMRRTGDTSPARVIFDRYLLRLEQRAAYLAGLLQTERFDFTTNERYLYDREGAARPADRAAAQALWRQQLRVEYLQEKLAGKQESAIVTTLTRRSARLSQTMRKLTHHAVLELYLNALASVYDPHSDYMGKEQMQSFHIAMNLSLVGIGAALQTDDGYCVIRELVPGGPAARGGQLKAGDRIVGVAQGVGDELTGFVDLVDLPLSQAVDLIRGAKGSTVRLTIIPATAAESVRKTLTIVRDEIKLEDQQAKAQIIELPVGDARTQRLGVIELPSFYAGTRSSATADVARLLGKLKEQKVAGVVLDLRKNGGGSLEEAINLTGLFIPSGPVVQTRDRDGRIEVGADNDGSVLYQGPLIVLTSRLSASASEIVAGALQDYQRALIVGDSATFGKGTVQTMVPLAEVMQRQGMVPHEDPGALKITISKFYRPSGASTQLKGVAADIVLPSLTDVLDIGEASLTNPLPWDTIQAIPFGAVGRARSGLLELRALSAERIAHDAAFTSLHEDRERLRTARAHKSVSLNEVERRREQDEQTARTTARKAASIARAPTWDITLKSIDAPGARALSPSPAETDADSNEATRADGLILLEAERILSDVIDARSRTSAARERAP